MLNRLSSVLCGFTLAAALSLAQAPAAGPTFDVATIKPAGSLQAQVAAGKLHIGMNIDAARVDIGMMSLADLLPLAFGVKPYQVSGPEWMRENRFDILATLPEGTTKDQVPQMMRALLEDRFKLTVHRESKDLPIYALVVGKNGPKLKEAAPPAEPAPGEPQAKGGIATLSTPEGQVRVSADNKGAVLSGGRLGTTRISPGPNGTMRMESSGITIQAFAEFLGRFVDRPVIDMTDLKGTYEFALDLSLDDLRNAARAAGVGIPGPPPGAAGPGGAPAGGAASDPSGGASIFDNVQKLGLRLDPRKSAVETIVVDHVEKMPTEN